MNSFAAAALYVVFCTFYVSQGAPYYEESPYELFQYFDVQVSESERRVARCVIKPVPGSNTNITGTITFEQENYYTPIQVTTNLKGFDPVDLKQPGATLQHGFHVHTYGDISEGCGNAGGHYNPDGFNHGSPTDFERHAGDFGNRDQTPDGRMLLNFTDPVATLYGSDSIAGRAIVIHAGVDDLGQGGNDASLANGNAGARLACCTIAHIKDPKEN